MTNALREANRLRVNTALTDNKCFRTGEPHSLFCVSFSEPKPKNIFITQYYSRPWSAYENKRMEEKPIRGGVFGRVLGRREASYLLFRLRLITVTAGSKE